MAYLVQWLFGCLVEYLGYLFYGLKFEGLEYLKECDLPVIFVSNHKSWIDHFIIIAGALRRKGIVPIHVLVADDIYTRPIVGAICRVLGAYPAQYGRGIEISLAPLTKDLARGHSVGLYPEGKIDKNELFGKPRPGTAWLALKSGRQIFPMAIKGLERFTWGSLFWGGRKVTIRYGKPFWAQGDYRNFNDVSSQTNLIMNRIITLYNEIIL